MPDPQSLPRQGRFRISVEGHWTLGVREVWPDGDGPENPTAEDVKAQMEACGSIYELMRSWNMEPDEAWVDGLKVNLT